MGLKGKSINNNYNNQIFVKSAKIRKNWHDPQVLYLSRDQFLCRLRSFKDKRKTALNFRFFLSSDFNSVKNTELVFGVNLQKTSDLINYNCL